MQEQSPQLQKYRVALHSMSLSLLTISLSACLLDPYSVSSVQTLEEAKVTRGCLYMAMPVQEVSENAYSLYVALTPN